VTRQGKEECRTSRSKERVSGFGIVRSGKTGPFPGHWRHRTLKTRLAIALRSRQGYQPKAEVAILTDQGNSILTCAMAGREDVSAQSFRGYYKALWHMDLWVDFIEPTGLSKTNYKVVIAPWHLIGKRETCERLRGYVERGGTLILEGAFGLLDECCLCNPVISSLGSGRSVRVP
jgi:beta-galactosidase GanA